MRKPCKSWSMSEGALLIRLWDSWPTLGPFNRSLMLEKHFPGRSAHSIMGKAERMGLSTPASVRHAREDRHRERARMAKACRLDEHLRNMQTGG